MLSYPVIVQQGRRQISATLRQGNRPGTFLVWADDPKDAPKVWAGSVQTVKALEGPMSAEVAARRFPTAAATISAIHPTE